MIQTPLHLADYLPDSTTDFDYDSELAWASISGDRGAEAKLSIARALGADPDTNFLEVACPRQSGKTTFLHQFIDDPDIRTIAVYGNSAMRRLFGVGQNNISATVDDILNNSIAYRVRGHSPPDLVVFDDVYVHRRLSDSQELVDKLYTYMHTSPLVLSLYTPC